ncbi:MAG TPA: translation initiation factor IF-2 [Polyangiaceae bacterium]|nr:translation initiation factor IF-2 [Polyangiaceae bacterium]
MADWAAREARRLQQRSSGQRPSASQPAIRRPGPARPASLRTAGPRHAPRPPARTQTHKAPPAPAPERSAHKRVVKVHGSIGVSALAASLGVKAQDVLLRLMKLGARGVHLNSSLDLETAALVATDFGWTVQDVEVSADERLRRARPERSAEQGAARAPVVTVMGHVDHGKTSLLDRIRHADVAAHEAGGITQHIGAYVADTPRGRITFIDTPGHQAFSELRARGARVTDLVVLVVAADDGVMPQTREAVAHARAAEVPIVVAINKLDVPGADPARVRRELSELGLTPEAWGGDTLVAEVSARSGAGIPDLLDKILLQAELLGLEASASGAASGSVLETRLDKGRGPLATVLVEEGTLAVHDVIVVGETWGRVRALFDDRGHELREAGPSTPVLMLGLEALPRAGDAVHVVRDIAAAQELTVTRSGQQRSERLSATRKASLADFARLVGPRAAQLKLVVKADSQGSLDAVRSLLRAPTKDAEFELVHAGVGAMTESDVQLAAASSALLVGFQVDAAPRTRLLARQLGVRIREHRLIYELADDLQRSLAALLEPELAEREIGRAEVRQVFSAGTSRAAGSRVTQGTIQRGARLRVERAGARVWQGNIASLRRFRDDAREVREGFDCGIVLDGFDQFEIGDLLVASLVEPVAPKISLAS